MESEVRSLDRLKCVLEAWDLPRAARCRPVGDDQGAGMAFCRRERGRSRRPGKSDPGDALAIARVTLREPDLPPVRLEDRSTELGLLDDARDDLVHAQTRARNRLHAHLVILMPGYGRTVAQLVSGRQLLLCRPQAGRGQELGRGPALPQAPGVTARLSAAPGGPVGVGPGRLTTIGACQEPVSRARLRFESTQAPWDQIRGAEAREAKGGGASSPHRVLGLPLVSLELV